MVENTCDAPLSRFSHYSKEDLAILFQYLKDHPPKFQKKKWNLGDYTLFVRFDSSQESRENTNQCINYDIPVAADSNQYIFFEIKDTRRKGRTTGARIESARFLAVTKIAFQINKEKALSPQVWDEQNYVEQIITNVLDFIGDPSVFFSRYEPAENSEDGTLEFEIIPSNVPDEHGFVDVSGHFSVSIDSFLPKQLPQFEPGEVNDLSQWCYDIKPEKTDAREVPGAYTTLSYQHLLSNGNENPAPWKLKISNYTLVKGNKAFTKQKNTTLFITFSTQVAQEIYDHIENEIKKYYEYRFDLAEIYQYLHSPFSQNNA